MTQNNVQIDDADDSCSNITNESEDVDVECRVVRSESRNDVDGSRINVSNLNLHTILPDKTSISHISSVALQNSTDITFGNKMCYSGPITVNQYGVEKPSRNGKNTVPCLRQWKILLTIAIVSISVSVVATILVLHFKNGDTDPGVINVDDDNTELRLVNRKRWKAKLATGELDALNTPVSLVIVQHTVQSSCDTQETCTPLVRQIQTQHINSDSVGDDIGYNFVVGGDGAVYVGRGWDKIGAHTRGYNSRSIGVAFIGDFRVEEPTNQQIVALLKLLRDGVKLKKLSENYSLIGALQVQQSESPGKKLFQILTKLPHWSDQIE